VRSPKQAVQLELLEGILRLVAHGMYQMPWCFLKRMWVYVSVGCPPISYMNAPALGLNP